MRIKTIHVEYQRKLNLGDYESVTLGASAWADLAETEGDIASAESCYRELSNLCKANVRERAIPFFKDGKRLVPKNEEDARTQALALAGEPELEAAQEAA